MLRVLRVHVRGHPDHRDVRRADISPSGAATEKLSVCHTHNRCSQRLMRAGPVDGHVSSQEFRYSSE
eukprot:1001084-Prymnesium_polylepis.1